MGVLKEEQRRDRQRVMLGTGLWVRNSLLHRDMNEVREGMTTVYGQSSLQTHGERLVQRAWAGVYGLSFGTSSELQWESQLLHVNQYPTVAFSIGFLIWKQGGGWGEGSKKVTPQFLGVSPILGQRGSALITCPVHRILFSIIEVLHFSLYLPGLILQSLGSWNLLWEDICVVTLKA